MARPLGEAVLRISAQVQGMVAGLKAASGQVKQFADKVKKMGQGLKQVGQQAVLVGVSLLAMFAPVVIAGASFEKQMSAVKAVMGDLQGSTDEARKKFQGLVDVAQSLGATTNFTAGEVGKAFEFLALAGFSADQAMKGVASTLALAAAGALDLGRAADIASDTMSAFKLRAEDLNRVADVMAAVASSANTSIDQMGEAMKFVAPVAASMGQSIEDVSVAIGLLGNSGIKASTAGTGLRQMFVQLVAQSDKADAVLRKYGSSFAAVNPEIVSTMDIIREFQRINLSAADAMDIFGARAGGAVLALKNSTVESMLAIQNAVDNAFGTALEQAATRIDNLAGKFTLFKSAMEGTFIALFDTFKGSLGAVIDGLASAAGMITAWIGRNKELAGTIAKVVAGIGAFLLVAGTIAVVVGGAIAVIAGIAAAIAAIPAGFAAAALSMTTFAAVVGAAAASVVAAFQFSLLIAAWDEFVDVLQAGWDLVIQPIIDGLVDSFSAALTALAPAFNWLVSAVKDLFQTLEFLMEALSPLKAVFYAIGAALAGSLLASLVAIVAPTAMFIAKIWMLVEALKFVVDLVIKAGRFLGILSEDTETSAESAESEAAARTQATKSLEEYLKATSKASKETKRRLQEDQEMVSLLSRVDQLNVQELNRLAELKESRENNKDALNDTKEAIEGEIAALTKKIAASKKGTQAEIDATAKLRILREQLRIAKENIEGLAKANAELGPAVNKTAAEHRADAKALQTKNEVMADAEKATSSLAATTKKFQDLRKELFGKELIGISKEIDQLEKLQDAFTAATAAMSADLIKLAVNERRIIQETVEGIRDLEIAKTKAEADGDARRVKQLQIAIEAEEAKRDAAKERLETNMQDQKDTNEDLAKSVDRAEEKRLEIVKKYEKQRDNFIRDNEIADARASGDKLRAAELEAQKLIEVETDRLNEISLLTEDQKKKELKRIQDRAAAIVKAAKDEVAGEKKKKIAEASKFGGVEDKAADNLAKQVQSVRQLVALFNVLGRLRRRQEEEAFEAAKKAVNQRSDLERIKANAAADPDNIGLQKAVALAERRVALAEALAQKKAAQAQLDVENVPQDNQMLGQKLQDDVNASVAALAGLKVQIDTQLSEITASFEAAGGTWIDIARQSWIAKAPELIAAVRNTMAEIKHLQKPTTKSSPSLIDVWDSNVAAVGEGIRQMSDVMRRGAPKMSDLNEASTQTDQNVFAGLDTGLKQFGQSFQQQAPQISMAPVIPPAPAMNMGGVKPQHSIKELKDNRSVSMVVNSNVDVADLKRQIGQALTSANMDSGGL